MRSWGAFTVHPLSFYHISLAIVIFITIRPSLTSATVIAVVAVAVIARSTYQLPSTHNERKTSIATITDSIPSFVVLLLHQLQHQIHHILYLPFTCESFPYSLHLVNHHRHITTIVEAVIIIRAFSDLA